MRAARRPGPAGVRNQSRVAGGSDFGVFEHVDRRSNGDKCPDTIGRAAGSIGKQTSTAYPARFALSEADIANAPVASPVPEAFR